MDEEVCSALEAAEEARALLPALLSAFDNHQVFTLDDDAIQIEQHPPLPDQLLQRAAGPCLQQPGGRHGRAEAAPRGSTGVGQGE